MLVERFKAGEFVDVTGVSKGKGFAGGVKRWHYARRRRDPRFDVSSRAGRHRRQFVSVARVEGQHFPGHMGNARVTAKNLQRCKSR